MANASIGHNSAGGTVTIESRLFNSLTRFKAQRSTRERFVLPSGATINDVLKAWGLPKKKFFFAFATVAT